MTAPFLALGCHHSLHVPACLAQKHEMGLAELHTVVMLLKCRVYPKRVLPATSGTPASSAERLRAACPDKCSSHSGNAAYCVVTPEKFSP